MVLTNSAEFKLQQRVNWTDLATPWLRWEHVFEEGASTVTRWLVRQAKLAEGGSVLDLAAGLGATSLAIADVVGASGHVVAQDISPEMVRIATEKAAQRGVTQLTFIVGDAEDLDVPAGCFDAVTSRWGLMFLPDLPGVLASAHRALRPGGRLTFSTWEVPPKVPVIALAFAEVARALELPPPPAGVPGPFSLSDPAEIEAMLRAAGFDDILIESKKLAFPFLSARQFVQFASELLPGFLRKRIAELPVSGREALLQDIERSATQRLSSTDGGSTMPSEALCFAATKPGTSTK